MGLDLAQVCARLESDKVKERAEGLAAIREAFAREHVVAHFDEDNKGKAWVTLFQALFSAVQRERLACTKTSAPSAVAVRRLQEAASVVRWLVERSVHVLNRRVLKPLLVHLQQSVAYHNQLMPSIAPDYVKAILALVANGPHADYLDEAQWRSLLSLAFAILLDKTLDFEIYDNDAEEEEEEEGDFSTPEPTGRKRAREASATPAPSKRRKLQHARQGKEHIDAAAIVRALVRSRHFPASGPELDALLALFHAFFVRFPADTTAHHDIVPALNIVLARATLSARNAVAAFSRKMWAPLCALWNTKERASKEALLIALRYLFPFRVLDEDDNPQEDVFALFKLIDNEPDTRVGAVPVLSLDALRLEVSASESAFVARTFRSGNKFNSGYALAWAALELQADCLYHVRRSSAVLFFADFE